MNRALALSLLLLGSPPAHGRWGVAYPPASGATRPMPAIVFLHGMWAGPEDACPPFEEAATPFGFLVCPRGNAPNGSGRMWAGSYVDAARAIDAALTGAAALAPGQIDRAGDGTLIGYSNGAYFAAEVACAQQGRWPGLVLLSMKVDLDPARLKKAGVRRVLLGAGDRDGASASMKAASERLLSGGVQARFMSLGPGGHEFPADIGARMCEAVAWVRYQAAGVCTPRP